MSITYHELNPRKSHIKLNDKTYILKKFGLAVQVWTHEEFATATNPNGLEVLSKRIEDIADISAWSRILYYLMEDKTDFPSYDLFLDALEKGGKYSKVIEAYNGLIQCIGNSQPASEDIEGDQELKKSKAAIA